MLFRSIVMTKVGGSEVVDGNGFVVEIGSSIKLREYVQIYTEAPNLLQRHAKRSREIAQSMSWTGTSSKYLKLYNKKVDIGD